MQPISVRFEKSVLERLRRLARAESLRRDTDVSMADLIREAILEAYPPDILTVPLAASEEGIREDVQTPEMADTKDGLKSMFRSKRDN